MNQMPQLFLRWHTVLYMRASEQSDSQLSSPSGMPANSYLLVWHFGISLLEITLLQVIWQTITIPDTNPRTQALHNLKLSLEVFKEFFVVLTLRLVGSGEYVHILRRYPAVVCLVWPVPTVGPLCLKRNYR